MTAYSRQDIEEAFACAGEQAEFPAVSVDDTREKVLHHLDGNCPCDRERCRHCRRRRANGIPRHEKSCPMTRA